MQYVPGEWSLCTSAITIPLPATRPARSQPLPAVGPPYLPPPWQTSAAGAPLPGRVQTPVAATNCVGSAPRRPFVASRNGRGSSVKGLAVGWSSSTEEARQGLHAAGGGEGVREKFSPPCKSQQLKLPHVHMACKQDAASTLQAQKNTETIMLCLRSRLRNVAESKIPPIPATIGPPAICNTTPCALFQESGGTCRTANVFLIRAGEISPPPLKAKFSHYYYYYHDSRAKPPSWQRASSICAWQRDCTRYVHNTHTAQVPNQAVFRERICHLTRFST